MSKRVSKRSSRSPKKLSAYNKFVKAHIKKVSAKSPKQAMKAVALLWRKKHGSKKSGSKKSGSKRSAKRAVKRSAKRTVVRRCSAARVAVCHRGSTKSRARVCQTSKKTKRQSCRFSVAKA